MTRFVILKHQEKSAQKLVLRNVYDELFHHGLSLSKLRDVIAAGRLLQSSDGGIGVPGRSLAWKARRTQ
jgi:hypothetical protein